MTFDADGGRRRAHHREVVFFVRRGESMDRVFVVCRRGGGGRVVSSCVPNISKRCFFVYHHQKQIIRSFVRSFVRTTGCSHGVIFCTFFRHHRIAFVPSRPRLCPREKKKKTTNANATHTHTTTQHTYTTYSRQVLGFREAMTNPDYQKSGSKFGIAPKVAAGAAVGLFALACAFGTNVGGFEAHSPFLYGIGNLPEEAVLSLPFGELAVPFVVVRRSSSRRSRGLVICSVRPFASIGSIGV